MYTALASGSRRRKVWRSLYRISHTCALHEQYKLIPFWYFTILACDHPPPHNKLPYNLRGELQALLDARVAGSPCIWEIEYNLPLFLRRICGVNLRQDFLGEAVISSCSFHHARNVAISRGYAGLASLDHRLDVFSLSYPGSPSGHLARHFTQDASHNTWFCGLPLLNVLTADVPRAPLKADGVLVSTGDREVVEAQIHAFGIFSIRVKLAQTRRFGHGRMPVKCQRERMECQLRPQSETKNH